MPTWGWILLVLTAVGFALRLLDRELGPDEAETFQKALAILFILAVIGGLILGFLNMDWH